MLNMEFWAKVNKSMTDEERSAFNEWKSKLWHFADRIRDESRRSSASIAFSFDANVLMQAINEVPHLTSSQTPQKEAREVTVEFLKQILEEMESNWHCIDSEWGPAKGGLEQEIADGHEPVIKELRKIISGENHV